MLIWNLLMKKRLTGHDFFQYANYHEIIKVLLQQSIMSLHNFISDQYKHGLIFKLLFGIFSIGSDFSRFHEEIIYLKDVLISSLKYF